MIIGGKGCRTGSGKGGRRGSGKGGRRGSGKGTSTSQSKVVAEQHKASEQSSEASELYAELADIMAAGSNVIELYTVVSQVCADKQDLLKTLALDNECRVLEDQGLTEETAKKLKDAFTTRGTRSQRNTHRAAGY